MWKKMGKVEPGNACSARSHLSKDEEPFQPFYDKQHAAPKSPIHKTSFCEAFMSRHYSADKPRLLTRSPTHSNRSSLISPELTKGMSQAGNDLFSLMRAHDFLAKKSSM
jgi:hypothetical protein